MHEDCFKETPERISKNISKLMKQPWTIFDILLKLQYFHNLFDGEAKFFYPDQVYDNVMSYEDAKCKMI